VSPINQRQSTEGIAEVKKINTNYKNYNACFVIEFGVLVYTLYSSFFLPCVGEIKMFKSNEKGDRRKSKSSTYRDQQRAIRWHRESRTNDEETEEAV